MKILRLLLLVILAVPAAVVCAQKTERVVMLSDIHLDPFHDPAKLERLRVAPVEGWAAIFDAQASATQLADFTEIQSKCGARGIDTPPALLEASLKAAHAREAKPLFVTVSGDLMAHDFRCRFEALAKGATAAEYSAFAAKTVAYIALRLRQTFVGVPVYMALGNNDSGCEDYREDPNSAYLQAVGKSFAEDAVDGSKRAAMVREFSQLGDYSVSLPMPHARLVVLQDIFESKKYTNCAEAKSDEASAMQIAWLRGLLSAARAAHEHVWVMAHIPPGVDAYSTFSKNRKVCAGDKAEMFLSSETLVGTLTDFADVIRLALFGHTHMDELRVYSTKGGESIPGKMVPSITPVNGNNPAFTVAEVDTATATLKDYSVTAASRPAGPDRWGTKDVQWAEEYRFSTTYALPDLSGASLAKLTAGLIADKTSASAVAQAYERFYFIGDPGISASLKAAAMQMIWPGYACSMTEATQAGFKACACAAGAATTK